MTEQHDERSTPAVSWPLRATCGVIGVLVTAALWGITGQQSASPWTPRTRALVSLLVASPFLLLAVFGAGRAIRVPEEGEDALDEERRKAHPLRSRLRSLAHIVGGMLGAYGLVRVATAGTSLAIHDVVDCAIGVLAAGDVLVRWRAARAARERVEALPSPEAAEAPRRPDRARDGRRWPGEVS